MLNHVLNLVFVIIGVGVLVGWIRHRAPSEQDIHKADISTDLTAGDELLEDVLREYHRREQ